jgi:hypothetical protein
MTIPRAVDIKEEQTKTGQYRSENLRLPFIIFILPFEFQE